MGPRLLLSHTIAPIKNRTVCSDFWSEKKSVRFFLGAACDKKSVVCADLVREKIGPSLRLFLRAPYDKKSVRVRRALVVGVSASRVVGRRFTPRPGYTKDHHKNGTNCLPAKQATVGV